jgi:type II secretory pathway component GspD/PulD (secretin)
VLAAKPGLQDFDLTGEPRALFDKIAENFGLQTVYDGDYPKTGTSMRFHVSRADYREAIHDLEAATGSFVIPLSGRLFMVAQDTPAKRNDLEKTMAIAIPVPPAMTTQELTEIAQILRQATNVEKIAWESTESRIVLRDRMSRVMPALALMNQLLSYRPEVMIDLQFLQVDMSDMVNYGFTVSNQFSAIYLGQILNNIISAPSGVTNLLTFGAGKTLIGITAAQVQAMFNETRSDSKSVYHAQLRSVSGQAATLHVGEKYPIITSGYVGTVPAGTTGTIYSPPPSFSFEDLGLEMKVTPLVNGLDHTTLTVETSFKVLTGDTVNNIPVIGNRGVKSQSTVRNGEWALIGTLVTSTKSKSASGFWGLAQIPLIGQLFKQTSTDKEESNVLIGIRTRLLSIPAGETVTKALRVGSDARPFTPL